MNKYFKNKGLAAKNERALESFSSAVLARLIRSHGFLLAIRDPIRELIRMEAEEEYENITQSIAALLDQAGAVLESTDVRINRVNRFTNIHKRIDRLRERQSELFAVIAPDA